MNLDEKVLRKLHYISKNPYNFVNELSCPGGVYDFSYLSDKEHLKWFKAFHNNRHCIMNVRRQGGKTLSLCIYALWFAMFNSDRNVSVSSSSTILTNDMLKTIYDLYQKLPGYIKNNFKCKKNAYMIEFENRSRIIAAPFHTSEQKECIKGRTVDLMIIDEFAHWKFKAAEKLVKAYFPVQLSGYHSKILIAGTPCGIGTEKELNYFYEIFSSKKNTFKKITYAMNSIVEKPEYDKMVLEHGKMFVEQEYCCKFVQVV